MSAMADVLTRVEVAERMTSEEFFRYAPEDQNAELIDGVMIVHSPPLVIHEKLQGFLLTLLRTYVEDNDLGEVLGSRTPVELEEDQVYEPDMLFIARERMDILEPKGVFGAPDLVIEILSASTVRYDRGAKFEAYERAGVRELWLIDPYGPAGTEFYQLQGKRFAPVMPDSAGFLRSVAVPGFWINVAWLWPRERFVPVREALAQIGAA
jgi:Uma2 family endonuclease